MTKSINSVTSEMKFINENEIKWAKDHVDSWIMWWYDKYGQDTCAFKLNVTTLEDTESCKQKWYYKVLLGYQLGQVVERRKNQCFEDHLCPCPQDADTDIHIHYTQLPGKHQISQKIVLFLKPGFRQSIFDFQLQIIWTYKHNACLN
jgi:hypothetical protein